MLQQYLGGTIAEDHRGGPVAVPGGDDPRGLADAEQLRKERIAKIARDRTIRHNSRIASRGGLGLNRLWEEQFVRAGYKYVFTEIPIAPWEFVQPTRYPGEPLKPKVPMLSKWVPEGDIVFGNTLEDLSWFDSKARSSTSFTTAQKMGYPLINQNGGIIQWDAKDLAVNLVDGKKVNLHDRAILAKRAHIGYEIDLSAVTSGQRDLPSLLEERRGQLDPKPTPLDLGKSSVDSRLVDRKVIKNKRGLKRPWPSSAPAAQPESATKAVTASERAQPTGIAKDAGDVADIATKETQGAAARSSEKAVGDRMVENRLSAPVAPEAVARSGGKEVVDVTAKAAAKNVRRHALLEFAGKGVRLTAKVGRVAFVILDFANPVFDLLMAVELVDALVAWLRREKIREEEEWRRLNDFLLGEPARITTPYGIVYWTSIRPMVNAFVEVKLAEDSYDRNFLYWLAQWNATPRTFNGFVYSQIDIDMERQAASSDGPYSVKYYPDAPRIAFTDVPQPNRRSVTSSVGLVGPQDKRNRSTGGGEARYDPESNISVDISFQSVRFTPGQPTLTPFDFLIVNCRHLIAEIVSFMSRFHPAIIDGMEIRTEIIDLSGVFRGEKAYWLQGASFPKPLDADEIHFCLKTIFWVVDKLETNSLRGGDYRRKDRSERFNAGYYRRLEILRLVTSPRGELPGSKRYEVRPLYDVAAHLRRIARGVDKAAAEDIDYLVKVARGIDDDLLATLRTCQRSPSAVEYNYQGKAPI